MTDEAKARAQITRQRNKEARAAARAEREAQERQDKVLVLKGLRAVLEDPGATAAQRIFAVSVMDRMGHYGYVPYDMKHLDDEIIAEFAKRLREQAGT